jgi:hypothetical protein
MDSQASSSVSASASASTSAAASDKQKADECWRAAALAAQRAAADADSEVSDFEALIDEKDKRGNLFFETRISDAERLKASGNELFKNGEYRKALRRYRKGLYQSHIDEIQHRAGLALLGRPELGSAMGQQAVPRPRRHGCPAAQAKLPLHDIGLVSVRQLNNLLRANARHKSVGWTIRLLRFERGA